MPRHDGCVALRNTCGVLTTDYAASELPGVRGTGTWTSAATFADPTPPNSLVVAIRARIYGGIRFGCPRQQFAPTLNGTALGVMVDPIIYQDAPNYCSWWDGQNQTSTGWMDLSNNWEFATVRNDGGIPNYVSGGVNTFDLGYSWPQCPEVGPGGALAIEKVELDITYRPVKVFVDVDGDFATNPTDDLPSWRPGSTKNGASVAPTMTGSLQTVALHVITEPRVKGTISLKLTDVSRYPGRAMNYPVSSAGVTPDMHFGNGSQTATKQIVASNTAPADTVFTLYIDDYGASGLITFSIPSGGKTPFTLMKRFPISKTAAGLPDAGWATASGIVPSGSVSSATEDVDALPVGPAQVGDGFSAYEEYRGFVVAGQHFRTHPGQRDLFLDLDPQIARDFINSNLPYILHFVTAGETSSTDVVRNGLFKIFRTAPVVDSSRDSPGGTPVPGASVLGQRAVRVIFTDLNYPGRFDPLAQADYPAWQFGILGNTWQDQMTIDSISTIQPKPFAECSPNENKFIEVFARTMSNLALHADLTWQPPRDYRDDLGQIVPDCALVPAGVPCDRHFAAENVILPQMINQLRSVLHSRESYSDEYYTKFVKDCQSSAQSLLSQAAFALLPNLVVGHEIGHYLTLDHGATCGRLMLGGAQGAMPDWVPFPLSYSPDELENMRTHL